MDNEQHIYDWLRGHGYTRNGTCAIMGSLQSESGFISYRLQGDMGYPNYTRSREHTDALDGGKISAYEFQRNGYGYGLAQWTYPPRKAALLSYCIEKHKSIGDMDAQLQFLDIEMRRDFPGLYKLATTSGTIEAISSAMVRQFENPADHAGRLVTDLRNALLLFTKYSEHELGLDLVKQPEPVQREKLTFEGLPVLSEKQHDALYTEIMHQLLFLHGYAVDKACTFDAEALRCWQEDHMLTADACCGPLTWESLIEEEDV